MSRKKILVVGAYGRQGMATIDAILKDDEYDVIAFCRNADKAKVFESNPRVHIAIGTMDDKASLKIACEGAFGFFFYSSNIFEIGMKAYNRHLRHSIDTAKECKIQCFIWSIGILQQKNSGVWFFDDAIRIEEELFASGMDSTILKPAVMLEDLMSPSTNAKSYFKLTPTTVSYGGGADDLPNGFISIEDIGNVAAIVFKNPKLYHGKGIDMASEALTGNQFAEIASRVRGKPITFIPQPRPLILRIFLPALVRHFDSLDFTFYGKAIPELKKVLPNPITVEQYLVKHNWATYEIPEEKKSGCLIM